MSERVPMWMPTRNAYWMISVAKGIAAEAHAGQVDKQGRDYFDAHLTPIADAASQAFADHPLHVEIVAAAWLHDAIEDTALTAADLRGEGMSAQVVDGVEAVTRRLLGSAKEPYLDGLITRSCISPVGRPVKIVDNAWNIICAPDLDPRADEPRSMLNTRYLPAREHLWRAYSRRTAGPACVLHRIDVVLRQHRARLNAAR